MKGRPPVSPYRLLAGLVLPLAAYMLVRTVTGSATGALAITEGLPAAWLFVADSAAARIVVFGTGVIVAIRYFRYQKARRERGRQPPAGSWRHG